jgi:hypothetical protein
MKGRKSGNADAEIKSNVYLILFSLAFIACGLPSAVFAQAGPFILDEPPADVAPPPLRMLSTADRKTLDSQPNLKKRTEISMQLMETKLASAEKFNTEDNFTQSIKDLSDFQAVLENTFTYLERNDVNNKADNRFKQLEIFLRRQVPRLETLRRVMPYKYGYYVLKLMKVVRDTRAKAVEPLFAESVVKSNP